MHDVSRLSSAQPAHHRFALLTGRTHPALAVEVADCLGVSLEDPGLVSFANGEIRARFATSVRGADVFVMQTHQSSSAGSINDAIVEQLLMIDAAKRASARHITAVCPLYGYARQDRKAEGREPITARLLSDMFSAAGADRIVSLDLHSGQIQGFFPGPVDHLTAMPVLEQYLRCNAERGVVIVAPDAGRVKVAEKMAQHLADRDADLAFVNKRRPSGTTNHAVAHEVIGDVRGRVCIITDDMIDTAGTLVAAAEILKARGAADVWAVATHAIFSGPALARLKASPLSRVVVTNSVPPDASWEQARVEVLSVAPVLAAALAAVYTDGSVSTLFNGENHS